MPRNRNVCVPQKASRESKWCSLYTQELLERRSSITNALLVNLFSNKWNSSVYILLNNAVAIHNNDHMKMLEQRENLANPSSPSFWARLIGSCWAIKIFERFTSIDKFGCHTGRHFEITQAEMPARQRTIPVFKHLEQHLHSTDLRAQPV